MNHEGEKKISQKTIGAVKVAASPSSSPPHPVSRRQRRFTKNFLLFWLKELLFWGMRIVVISSQKQKKGCLYFIDKRNPQNGKIQRQAKEKRIERGGPLQ
jgi:hypothetical protein